MPMTATEYAATRPKLTGTGGMLFTVGPDRPVMLHSVYDGYDWMLPGGNMEEHEDPKTAACREALEETGLTARGPMGLLLVEFWRSRLDWPHGRVVCVFDGGTITPGELEQIKLDPNEHHRYLALEWDRWTTEAPPWRVLVV
ncbi:NUDIX domain-containing protein [Streptomyces olivoreticuli]